MTAALVLRNTDSPGLAGAFSLATRARLVTGWPHAGMVVDGTLMHATLAGGLHAEPFEAGKAWDTIALPEAMGAQIKGLFSVYKGAQYDAISLLAFVLPWRVSDASRMYCFEWCWLAMAGQNPSWRVTPEQLLFLAHQINTKEESTNG
ncbi:MAG: hypothetical protein KIS62_01220 [Ramlibacter sp.]|nr:hypothetical protein [Ramlibacter sp.]